MSEEELRERLKKQEAFTTQNRTLIKKLSDNIDRMSRNIESLEQAFDKLGRAVILLTKDQGMLVELPEDTDDQEEDQEDEKTRIRGYR